MNLINKNSYLTTWAVSDLNIYRYAEFFIGTPIDEPFDYHFKNGKGLKGDSFCRNIFKKQMANRPISLKDKPAINHIYNGFGTKEVDFSSFKHYAAHAQKWLETILVADADGDYQFEISTCGSIRIWLDNDLISTFTPLTRNKPQTTTLTLKLKKGNNLISVHMEDLFERDTIFLSSFCYVDSKPLSYILPNINMDTFAILQNFIAQITMDLSTINHRAKVNFNANAPANFSLKATINGMPNDNFKAISTNDISIMGGDSECYLDLPDSLGSAHYHFTLQCSLNGLTLSRLFGVNVMPSSKEQTITTAPSLSERKKLGLEFIAKHGMDRTNRLLAILSTTPTNTKFTKEDVAWQILESTLSRISLREDCSDFSIVPLLVIYKKFVGQAFPNVVWNRVKSTLLGYRYWLDEKGNDVMWFWSENHTLCFHTAQYLAGSIFTDDIFINSNLKGSCHKKLGYDRLMAWFDAIDKQGFVEWNSAPYYPVDFIGLFALYNLADDIEIKNRAKKLIDDLMLLNSLHYQAGLASGTMGRVYEKELLAITMNELSAYGNVAFGGGYFNRKCASLPLFCLSDYEVNEDANYYANYNKDGAILAHYIQGGAKITAIKQNGVAMSSILINSENGAAKKSHQEHVLDVQFSSNSNAKLWINHPGDTVLASEKRPSFWAGNLIMPYLAGYKNRALMLYTLDDDIDINFTHLYLPSGSLDEVIKQEKAIFIRSGNAYMVVLTTSNLTYLNDEARQNGKITAWYVAIGNSKNNVSFKDFVESYQNITLNLSDDGIDINDPSYGNMLLSKTNGLSVNNKAEVFTCDKTKNLTIEEINL